MSNTASEIAAFLHGEAKGLTSEEMRRTISQRWPNATGEEIGRATKIAIELTNAEAAEYFAEADALGRYYAFEEDLLNYLRR